jgi:hypothetical protein
MLAKELIKILQENPTAEIKVCINNATDKETDIGMLCGIDCGVLFIDECLLYITI